MPWNPVTGRYEGESAVTSQLPPEVVESERRRRMTPADEAIESLAQGEGRLLAASRLLGSAGGGSSSMALGGRVSAGPIYGELARITGEALRSIPTAIRRTLTGPKRRRIAVGEYQDAAGQWDRSTKRILGQYDNPIGDPGQGLSVEHITVQPDLPAEVKKRIILHELQHAQQEAGKGPGPLAVPAAQAAPGQAGFLYEKGYPAADIAYEIPAHAVETTAKPRYHLTSGEESVRAALVRARRGEAKTLQKIHKAKGLERATRNEAEVQRILREMKMTQ